MKCHLPITRSYVAQTICCIIIIIWAHSAIIEINTNFDDKRATPRIRICRLKVYMHFISTRKVALSHIRRWVSMFAGQVLHTHFDITYFYCNEQNSTRNGLHSAVDTSSPLYGIVNMLGISARHTHEIELDAVLYSFINLYIFIWNYFAEGVANLWVYINETIAAAKKTTDKIQTDKR